LPPDFFLTTDPQNQTTLSILSDEKLNL